MLDESFANAGKESQIERPKKHSKEAIEPIEGKHSFILAFIEY